jgi:hypothetical protein
VDREEDGGSARRATGRRRGGQRGAAGGRGRRGGGRRTRARPGCVVLDGGPTDEQLGFGGGANGGAGWPRLQGNLDGASPMSGGAGVAGERRQV